VSTVTAPAEQRVVLRSVRWETYERLVEDHTDMRSPRFSYDRGVLEIMSPGTLHERLADLVRSLVITVAETWEMDVTGLGSVTFRDPGWARGFEPDACFYVLHAAAIRDKTAIDPRVDPPPDVVFEVDITRSSIDKLALYAQFGVPEVWRHDGADAAILLRAGDGYTGTGSSRSFPGLGPGTLTRLLDAGLRTPLPRWIGEVRDWAATAR